MQPEDFARAAAALRAGAGHAAVPGFPGGLGAGMAALAGLAAGCTRVFLTRPPLAPGAVICGASHSPAPGIRAHAAGIGPSPQAAFARAMGEVAEARALWRRPRDPRIAPDGTLPLLDHRLRPIGRIPARGLLREAEDGPASGLDAEPRSPGPGTGPVDDTAPRRREGRQGIGHAEDGSSRRPSGPSPTRRQDTPISGLGAGSDACTDAEPRNSIPGTGSTGYGESRDTPGSSPAQRQDAAVSGLTARSDAFTDADPRIPIPRTGPAGHGTSQGTPDSSPAQRQDTAVSGLGAGPDAAMAARAAWHEAVERHAIALWFHDGAPAALLPPPPAARAVERALRQGAAAPALRYLLLPGAVRGLAVVAALSEGPWGLVPGYGCAPDPAEAACKAATEAAMGEFALHLEARAQAEQGLAPPPGGFTARAALLAARPDLLAPATGPPPPGPDLTPRFADLTLPGEGIVALRTVLPALRQPGGTPGPV